jgi:hypothetical protein
MAAITFTRGTGTLAALCGLLGLPGCYQGQGDAAQDGSADDGASGGGGSVDDDAGDDESGDAADEGGSEGGEPEVPFVPLPAEAALARVKNFLTGLPPTDEERAQYLADPESLRTMIDGWMATPEYEARALDLFRQLLQQSADTTNLSEFLDLNQNRVDAMEDRSNNRLVRSLEDSFAYTALDIVKDGRPFTEIVTTRTFQLNVPLMTMLAYLDARPRNDFNDNMPSWLLEKYDGIQLDVVWEGTAIPLAQTLNPSSGNFMRWYLPDPPTGNCVEDLVDPFSGNAVLSNAFSLMFQVAPGNVGCSSPQTVFTNADWELRPITIREPMAGEDHTEFWDIETLRATDELVLATDRVGFFTTLGFSAKWTTNDSNEHRVNANQTLIVGLGRTFDPENVFVPADGAGIDEDHATPGTTCYACHKDLDPMRDFLRQSYSYAGTERLADPDNETVPATAYFSVDGSEPVAGNGVYDLADAMATHPRFAVAWAEKLCAIVNAGACDAQDPELTRIGDAFAASNHDFSVLVRELLSSPIVTFAERTTTWDKFGAPVPIVVQDDFCRRLSSRFGIADICNLRGELDAENGVRSAMRALSDGIPPVSYGRSTVLPFVAEAPDVFFVASVERMCQTVAETWLGNGDAALWAPSDREEVLDMLVADIMGVPPSDPRAPDLRRILAEHWDEAVAAQTDGTDDAKAVAALRSTFMIACGSAPALSTTL